MRRSFLILTEVSVSVLCKKKKEWNDIFSLTLKVVKSLVQASSLWCLSNYKCEQNKPTHVHLTWESLLLTVMFYGSVPFQRSVIVFSFFLFFVLYILVLPMVPFEFISRPPLQKWRNACTAAVEERWWLNTLYNRMCHAPAHVNIMWLIAWCNYYDNILVLNECKLTVQKPSNQCCRHPCTSRKDHKCWKTVWIISAHFPVKPRQTWSLWMVAFYCDKKKRKKKKARQWWTVVDSPLILFWWFKFTVIALTTVFVGSFSYLEKFQFLRVQFHDAQLLKVLLRCFRARVCSLFLVAG